MRCSRRNNRIGSRLQRSFQKNATQYDHIGFYHTIIPYPVLILYKIVKKFVTISCKYRCGLAEYGLGVGRCKFAVIVIERKLEVTALLSARGDTTAGLNTFSETNWRCVSKKRRRATVLPSPQ